MFLDNIKLIVKMNKEEELGKWLFNPDGNLEFIEDNNVKAMIENSLRSLKIKICRVRNALLYDIVENNNFNNVISEYVYSPLNFLNLKLLEELTDEEKCKLDILILYRVLYIKHEKTLGINLLLNENLKFDLTNYDNSEHVRNHIKKEKQFNECMIVAKIGKLYNDDLIIKYLNIQ